MKDTQILSIDVSKRELEVFDGRQGSVVSNCRKDILALLRRYPKWTLVCEPTSVYHLELATLAHSKGLRVCLVNPKEMNNYRECRSFRAKTDKLDSRSIYEFALRHHEVLRTWEPPSEDLVRLRKLMAKRMAAVNGRTRFAQAFGKDPQYGPVDKALTELIAELDVQIKELAGQFADYDRMCSMAGVGPCGAAALTYLLNMHEYTDDDALVAFTGLDLRVRDSGCFRGQRKLSKRGDPLLRYYITMTGFGLLKCRIAQKAKASLQLRGRKHKEMGVIAARKILRTAFALHNQQKQFDQTKWRWIA